MHKITSLLALAFFSFMVSCCEEIPPKITPCQTNRVVLVEEFTGVSCVNCPTGTEKLEQLSQQNPDKIIVVGIHAGFWAVPDASNQNTDFRCPDGDLLESSLLGPVSSYPSASINRKIFEGESELPTELTEWAGYIGSELCNRPVADLAITSTYDDADGKATITVDMTPSGTFTGLLENDLALTIMLTESNIIGYQKTPTGSNYSYNHKHVLRDVLTSNYSGDVLITKNNVLSAKQTVITDYTIPADWDADNLHVVAFIHNKSDADKSVLQAVEKHLK